MKMVFAAVTLAVATGVVTPVVAGAEGSDAQAKASFGRSDPRQR